MKRATAYANANIALVKYWGKNDSPFNIPAVPSLSMTLDNLGTTVTVAESPARNTSLVINGEDATLSILSRLTDYLTQIKTFYSIKSSLKILSKSTIPIAAGLASSASFYAALACAINEYFALGLSVKDLSMLSRIGSGSAARSIYAGFAALHGGPKLDHEAAFAYPLEVHEKLKLVMVIAIVTEKAKTISSRDAMNHTKRTSPFFKAFMQHQKHDMERAVSALRTGRFDELGQIMEHSTLKMFACMWSAAPAINYWHPHSLALIDLVYQLRALYGPHAFFTMDAGPNVKILCLKDFLPTLMGTLLTSNLASKVLVTRPGLMAQAIDEHLL